MEIRFEDVSFTYEPNTPMERRVLRHLNMSIAPGKWNVIIGPSGSGKSTLLQHMNGLLFPTEGNVHIGPYTLHPRLKRKHVPPLFKHVGYVFQFPEQQLFAETVAEDIAYGPLNCGYSSEQAQQAVHWAMAQVGLDDTLICASPLKLSGGQQRRVAIAGVLAMEPDVLVLDEPTAGLDPLGKADVLNQLQKWLADSKARSIVMITHEMDIVAEYADQVIVLDDGMLVWEGHPLALFWEQRSQLEQYGLTAPVHIDVLQALHIHPQSARMRDAVQAIAGASEAINTNVTNTNGTNTNVTNTNVQSRANTKRKAKCE